MMALNADFKWYIKEHGLDLVAKIFAQLDPVLALLGSQVGGVYVIQGAMRDQARFEHGAQI
jgi:hypothetical protein